VKDSLAARIMILSLDRFWERVMVGEARLERADRSQVRLEVLDVEGLVPAGHRVRAVWAFVSGLDLSRFHDAIRAREGHAGRPAIDPAILLCLWLYATLDDVGSARELERLTRLHNIYRWICGGVSVNHHTLSDFRVEQAAFLDELLARAVVALMDAGVASLEEVAQDGLRTRASAGGGSFRRRASLEKRLDEAQARVARLKAELKSDPAASGKRRAAAQARAARQAEERARAALDNLAEIEKRRERSREG
jgi:transposase